MCRTPEIVAVEGSAFPGGPISTSYRCINCDRWAYVCPLCRELSCASDLHMSMIGSIPLACKVCRPDGIRQAVTIGTGLGFGPYRDGTVLTVDDDNIEGFRITGPPNPPEESA